MGVLVYWRWLLVLVGFKRSWWHLDLLPPDEDSGTERCRLYLSVPRPLQTVQRAELWRVITALQASKGGLRFLFLVMMLVVGPSLLVLWLRWLSFSVAPLGLMKFPILKWESLLC